MRFLLSLCLLLPLTGLAATGDIIEMIVRPDGYSVDYTVEGYGAGGDQNYRLITNTIVVSTTNGLFTNFWYEPGPQTPYIDVHSPKITAGFGSNYLAMRVYLTANCRSNVPNQTVTDQRVAAGGGFVTNRAILSDFIAAGDTLLGFTAPTTGMYSNSAAVSGLTVTKQTTLGYPPPAAIRFTKPGWQLESGSTMTVKAVGFAHWPTNFQPLEAMGFVVTGQDAVAVTNWESAMRIDWSENDALPFAEYISTFALTNWSHSNELRVDIIGLPNRGTNILTTIRNEWTQPTASLSAITNFYYTNAVYNAVVSEDGTNSTGRALQLPYDQIPSSNYFKNGFVAWNAIRGSNGTSYAGCTVYYRTGKTNWSEGTITAASSKAWATIAEYPGDTVIFTNHNGSTDIGDRVRVKDVELGYLGNVGGFGGIEHLWLDDVLFNSTAGRPIVGTCQAVYITQGRAPVWTQGFRPFSTENVGFALIRGVDMTGMNGAVDVQCVVGNKVLSTGGNTFNLRFSGSGFPQAPGRHQLVYNNQILGVQSTDFAQLGATWPDTNGIAVVQNIFEGKTAGSSWTIYAGNTTSSNILLMHNIVDGFRDQFFYNGTPYTEAIPRWYCHDYNNIFCGVGEATDTDPTVNSNRVGDWMVRNRVGTRGQLDQMADNQVTHSAAASHGINNFLPGRSALTTSLQTSTNWMQYWNRAGSGVSAAGAGGGDYRMRWGPGIYLPTAQALPYDIFASRRHRLDPPGAIAVSPRVGGFFQ